MPQNFLVGNYNAAGHNAYQGLQHGRLNHVFMLVGVLCQPNLNPLCRNASLLPRHQLRH
jgi:hypothetical protein